ncbi:MAG TPA: hypothetical protein ENK18_14435, partial [Deltaproteobacteria bacterium]|nr:hypothetical protein [Deltaproteobacteria bacterium]
MIVWILWVGAALACAPRFSVRLLDDRSQALLDLPEGSFAHEAVRLVPPPTDRFTVQTSTGAEARSRAEAVGLSEAQQLRVAGMRAAETASLAREVGAGLPRELFQYTLGAVALQRGDEAEALRWFSSVRGLP